MSVKIKLRRGTSSEWTATNPTLKDGEPGFELDTGKLKIGNGSGVWTDLPYLTGDGGGEIVLEDIDDRVADLLIAGQGITLSYNDNANSLTIDADPTYDAAVDWTANHTLADGTRYLVNDLVYVSGNLYKANYENESIEVSNTTYWTNVGSGYRLNIDGRDIPNIPYPVDTVNGQTGDVNITDVDRASAVVTNVFNKTGSPISKFKVVYINGGQGDQPTIGLASSNGEGTSSKTYGITYDAINNMDSGRVIVLGALTGVNTDQFNPTAPTGDVNGVTLWLSTSGDVTTTKPTAPYHAVSVGTIVRTHQNEGVVEVRIQNGYELDELHNVAVSGVTDGQFLNYNSASGLWVPTSSGTFSSISVGAFTNTQRNSSTINQNTVSSSQNDYNLGTGPMTRLSVSNAGLSITGFSGYAGDGDTRIVFNAGPNAINISHDSSSSTAANRILIYSSGTFTLYPNNGMTVIYDNTSQRWRLF